MSHRTIASVVFFASLSVGAPLQAQRAVDPSGHWEGKLQTPAGQLSIEVDLAKDPGGVLIGSVGIKEESLKGLPLQGVTVEGSTLSFHARRDQPFEGEISADGKTISGTLNTAEGGAPLTMTRTGEAVIEPPLTSDPIARDLEGVWNASLMTGQGELSLVLNLANQSDGTGMARLINVNQGGLVLPARFVENAPAVTLEFRVVPLSFSGALNAARNEITGTVTQGAMTAPLTFKKAGY